MSNNGLYVNKEDRILLIFLVCFCVQELLQSVATSERCPRVLPEDRALLPKLVWSLHVTCDFSSVQHLGVCLSQPPMAVPLPFCVDSLLCDGPWLPVQVTWAG